MLYSSDHTTITVNTVAKENRPKKFSTCTFSTCIFNFRNGTYEEMKKLKNKRQNLKGSIKKARNLQGA